MRQEVGPEEGKRGRQTDRDRERESERLGRDRERERERGRGRDIERQSRWSQKEVFCVVWRCFVFCFVFGVDSGQNDAVFFRTIRHCLEYDW